MTIAILGGTGHQGGGLAQRFASAGRDVIVGSRDPNRARGVVAGWDVDGGSIEVAANGDAVARADVTLLAVPFAMLDAILDEARARFRDGSIVVDVTVPIAFTAGKMTMIDVAEGSASEHVRARLPVGVQLAAAFKTLPAEALGDRRESLQCDEFVCGDSDAARAQAAALVGLIPGLRAVDVGPLSRARFIEHMTALAIAINRRHKIHGARFRVVGLP